MDHTGTVLCLDAGQTTIKTQLRDHGDIVNESQYPGVATDQPLFPQLAETIQASLRDTNSTPHSVAIGSSGLADHVDADELFAMLNGTGIHELCLAHDSITSYLGAIGDEPGAVIASGTGVVTLAVGDRDVARVDGWGYLIGDAGSGFWIGRAALDHAMQAYDGRGEPTVLTEIMRQDFPVLSEAYLQLQADDLKVSRIASYARAVAEHATTDEVCRRISQRAGELLAHSVGTGLRRVGQAEQPDPVVGVVGKVFGNSVLRDRFQQILAQQFPALHLIEDHSDGLVGCYQLTRVARDSALYAHIARASVAVG